MGCFFCALNCFSWLQYFGVDRNISGTMAVIISYKAKMDSSLIGTVAEIHWYDWVLRGVDTFVSGTCH